MFRNIALILLCAATSLSTPAYSTMTHSLQKGITLEYDLPAHDPQVFINYMFWSIEANCKVTSEAEGVDLFVEALAKKGKVNGVTLTAGQSMLLHLNRGEHIKLNADSGAKVQITNINDVMVHATCIS